MNTSYIMHIVQSSYVPLGSECRQKFVFTWPESQVVCGNVVALCHQLSVMMMMMMMMMMTWGFRAPGLLWSSAPIPPAVPLGNWKWPSCNTAGCWLHLFFLFRFWLRCELQCCNMPKILAWLAWCSLAWSAVLNQWVRSATKECKCNVLN